MAASFSNERFHVRTERKIFFFLKDKKLAITKLRIIRRMNGELTGSGQACVEEEAD